MAPKNPKIKISKIVLSLILSLYAYLLTGALSSPLWAEDYPSGYLGPGYREYLNGKIQDGYYVDAFTKLDNRLKTRVDKRNQVEEILGYAYRATPQTHQEIVTAMNERQENSYRLNAQIINQRNQREKNASAQSEFTYIPFPDGKI
jgi:hypothetical protein